MSRKPEKFDPWYSSPWIWIWIASAVMGVILAVTE